MPENLYTPNSIRTYTGKYFDFTVMDPDTICIEDIAHALSHMPRFAGHTQKLYSVAQHCVNACLLAPEHLKLDALLHDGIEAFIMDIPKPLKMLLPDYMALEDRLAGVFADKFQAFNMDCPEVKEIDKMLLEQEWHDVMLFLGPPPFPNWNPEYAERTFLKYYEKYKRV
jgi:hypothetical protein